MIWGLLLQLSFASHLHGEMQIKTMMRYITSHHSEWPSSKSLQTINVERVWRKGNAPALLVRMLIDTATMEDSMESPLKTRNKSTIWPSNPTPRHIPEETRVEKDTCITLFIASLYTIARTCKQSRCPSTDEWIKKLWYIYTMEYYSAIKRNSFESVLMRSMNLEPIIQSEVSQKEKDKYRILTHIYGI